MRDFHLFVSFYPTFLKPELPLMAGATVIRALHLDHFHVHWPDLTTASIS